MAKTENEPKIITPADIDPRHDWERPIMALGPMAVDFEERIDFRRLHRYRLARTRAALAQSELGSLLVLRPVQHPLHHLDGDRQLGARQVHALCAPAGRRRAASLGFRLGGEAPPPLCAVAAAA